MSAGVLDAELLQYATAEERQALEQALSQQQALLSPLDFAAYATKGTQRYRHLELLNQYLVALHDDRLYIDGPGPAGIKDDEGILRHPERGDKVVSRLAISMGPRMGKSYTISEHGPAWFLARFPEKRIIFASYEADFAASWGGKARDLLERHPELGIEVDRRSRATDHWNLNGHRGGMDTAGIGGPVTGKGADWLLIDDPIKNDSEAMSEIYRNKHDQWLRVTADSRLEPGGKITLIMTRWHEDDVLGRQLLNEPDEWCYLNLKALADHDDPLGRQPGEALCPERYDVAALRAIQRRRGPYWFSANYQGEPSTEGSGIFTRSTFRYWVLRGAPGQEHYVLLNPSGNHKLIPRDEVYVFGTLDLAGSEKTSADFTVFSVWGVTYEKELLLLERVRTRLESADHDKFVLNHFRRLKPSIVGVPPDHFGRSVIKNMMRAGLPVIKLKNLDKDKISRALPAGAYLLEGMTYFPQQATWIQEWESEHLQFPNGAHDDQVDTHSDAIFMLQHTGIGMRRRTIRGGSPVNADERAARHLQRLIDEREGRGRRHPVIGRTR